MDVSILLIVLLAGTLGTYLSGDKWASRVALLFGFLAAALSLFLVNQYQAGVSIDCNRIWVSHPQIGFALKGDGLSMALVLLTCVLTPLIMFSTFGNSFHKPRALYSLVMFMAFAMTGSFLASDGFLYYIFWELALIPIYFIALLWGNGDAESRKKAILKFFIYTFAGSLFMLVAFIYLYQKVGSFLLTDLYSIQLSAQEQCWIFLAFFLAYAIKIPLVPFHTWQADTYSKAPALGTMLLSGIMLKMALYSIIRWQLPIAPDAAVAGRYWYMGLGIAGVIYGSVLALKQDNIKKLLAYSSLAHVGLIAAGIYTLTLDGLRGGVLQMLAHGFVIVGLFFVAEIIDRRYKTLSISEMGGIRSQATRFASVFMVLTVISVALPGTFSFVGEFELLYSLSQIHLGWALAGGLTIILGAYYMLQLFQRSMLGAPNMKTFADINTHETVVFVMLITLLIFFGLYPRPIVDLITPSLNEILQVIAR